MLVCIAQQRCVTLCAALFTWQVPQQACMLCVCCCCSIMSPWREWVRQAQRQRARTCCSSPPLSLSTSGQQNPSVRHQAQPLPAPCQAAPSLRCHTFLLAWRAMLAVCRKDRFGSVGCTSHCPVRLSLACSMCLHCGKWGAQPASHSRSEATTPPRPSQGWSLVQRCVALPEMRFPRAHAVISCCCGIGR